MRRGEHLATAAQNIAEFWKVSTRPASARGGYGQTIDRVQRRVAAIERFCEILIEGESSYDSWKSLVTNLAITGVSVHGARLVAVMTSRGISRILIFNGGDFQRFTTVQGVIPTPAP